MGTSLLGFSGRLVAPLLLLSAPVWPAASEPALRLPVDCVLDETCYVQRYVDRDPGPGIRDFGCGTLAGDGHKGTDFAVPSLAAMAEGVAVVAAAPGTVLRVRDGMADISTDAPDAPDIAGRECGNAAVIGHGDGWETIYCHLRQGSVAVAPGDRVAAGTPLGLVGMSGLASFPHVHFGVQRDGVVVDPYRPDGAQCGADAEGALWAEPQRYRPLGVVSAGFAEDVPEFDAVKAGLPEDGIAAADRPVVLWAQIFGARQGDVVAFALAGPDGSVERHTTLIRRDQPLLFRAWGKRAPEGGWTQGIYSGRIALTRGGVAVEERTVRAALP